MIKSYLKLALRNLRRNRSFTVINVGGLTLGITCSLLIFLWIRDEYSVDHFHKKIDQLYEVYERVWAQGKTEASYLTPGLLAAELKKEVPEVEYASSLERDHPFTFQAGEKIVKMDGSYAGPDFFRMFSFPLLQGTPATALGAPGSIAISRKMAVIFFGSPELAIGKALRYEDKATLHVTAVFADPPASSSLQFDFLRSWADYETENPWVSNWGNTSPYCFVQLRRDADPRATATKILHLISRYRPQTADNHTDLLLQPFGQKYLHARFRDGVADGGRIQQVRIFTLVALFILLIACINFMNLATAYAGKRAREVGVRKVIGATRRSLLGQFLGEALLLTLVSFLLALLLTDLLLPVFNQLTAKQISLPLDRAWFWASLPGLLVLTGLVAGSYPAVFLSGLRPAGVLSGSWRVQPGGSLFRKGLVVFQFVLSVVLIVGMICIDRQMDYVLTENLGYDRSNLVYIPIEGDLIHKYDLFKVEAARLTGIVSISKMKESPTVIGHTNGDISWEGKDPRLLTAFSDAQVGYDFVRTMHLDLVAGRDFSRGYNDSDSYLVNETAARKMGYTDPVGKPLWWGDKKGKIIGELKDFHFGSLHDNITPLVIRFSETEQWGTILVRIRPGETRAMLAALEGLCKQLNPDFPFSFSFSDQEYTRLYRSDQVVSKLTGAFAVLAIFISCLGLFGLTAFTAAERTREIGVRKVLGATSGRIVVLLARGFLQPVAIAMVLGAPLAAWICQAWLNGYAYRVALQGSMFLLAGGAILLITGLTISFQAIRAAVASPTRSLRSE